MRARAEHDRGNNAWNKEEDEGDLDRGPVKGKNNRADELASKRNGAVFLLITRSDKNRRAVRFEERGDLVVVQGPAELRRAIVDFGLEIGSELGGDVVALLFREPEFHGSEVAIE